MVRVTTIRGPWHFGMEVSFLRSLRARKVLEVLHGHSGTVDDTSRRD